MNYKELLKYVCTVAIAGSVFSNNAFGEEITVSLSTFFDKTRWIQSKTEAQKKYAERWKEEYFKNPREAYQANLRDDYKETLSDTHLYILVSSYKQAKIYGSEIVKSLEANAQHLKELGVTPHIVVRCDGEKTEKEEHVISGDLRTYAEILNAKQIAFKIHESERVNPLDFKYEYHNPEAAHWELVANESNRGCSGTRHASIAMIEEEVKELRKQGKYVYIGIFDGDDWVHEDFYPVLVLNALYTNAPVSNYNGRMGAHGLEHTGLRTKRMLGIGKEYAWTVYTDMRKDEVEETLSKEYEEMHPNACGSCCTTKIFEADYFYGKLNSLHEKKLLYYPNAKRNWIDLTELSCLDGYGKGACTCTTKENLFYYTQH